MRTGQINCGVALLTVRSLKARRVNRGWISSGLGGLIGGIGIRPARSIGVRGPAHLSFPCQQAADCHYCLRIGELLELTWREVDFTPRTLTVFRSKNGERRTIPVNETVLSMLRRKSTLRSLRTEVVFYGKVFTPMESGHPVYLHHATCAAGVDLYKVQRLLGHKSPIMTQHYAHHYSESLRDGVEILDQVPRQGTNVGPSSGSLTAPGV